MMCPSLYGNCPFVADAKIALMIDPCPATNKVFPKYCSAYFLIVLALSHKSSMDSIFQSMLASFAFLSSGSSPSPKPKQRSIKFSSIIIFSIGYPIISATISALFLALMRGLEIITSRFSPIRAKYSPTAVICFTPHSFSGMSVCP